MHSSWMHAIERHARTERLSGARVIGRRPYERSQCLLRDKNRVRIVKTPSRCCSRSERYVLYPLTIVLIVTCSAGSRMRISPIGAGSAPLAPPGDACDNRRMRASGLVRQERVDQEVSPAPPVRQLGSSVVVVPACASKPALKVGFDIAAAANRIGTFVGRTLAIITPFTSGTPARSAAIVAS